MFGQLGIQLIHAENSMRGRNKNRSMHSNIDLTKSYDILFRILVGLSLLRDTMTDAKAPEQNQMSNADDPTEDSYTTS
eukprot:1441078-Amphidinium_carterae.1